MLVRAQRDIPKVFLVQPRAVPLHVPEKVVQEARIAQLAIMFMKPMELFAPEPSACIDVEEVVTLAIELVRLRLVRAIEIDPVLPRIAPTILFGPARVRITIRRDAVRKDSLCISSRISFVFP